jgi:hypothetical protein
MFLPKVSWLSTIYTYQGHSLAYWLKRYATIRKVAGLIPDKVIEFIEFTWSFQPHHGPGVYSASNRYEYEEKKNVLR